MSFVRVGGIVNLKLSPPIEFIEAQTGTFKERLRDLSGLWRRFSRTMAAIERDRFASEGDGTWPPLAPSTVLEKERRGFPPFPLIRTGDLYQSLTDPTRAAAFSAQEMSYGTDVSYARYHQEGGQRVVNRRVDITEEHEGKRYAYSRQATFQAEGHPPQRKVLDITVADRRRLETDMVAYINQAARDAFGAPAL